VLQVRGGADLREEALRPDYGGQLGLQDLERDLPVVLDVLGQIDRRHAALTELPLDAVLAVQCGFQASGVAFGHQGSVR
jgi:hypothetical protein